jgi:hypothetical protein
VLGRRKDTQVETPTTPQEEAPAQGKNRPTPKRREVEAARRQPLVPDARGKGKPQSKEGRRAQRDAARQQRLEARARMMTGDERYLAARDRGPVRRFARDFVDARWNLGEMVLPVMVVVLLLSFVGSSLQRSNPQVFGGLLAVTYVMIVFAAVDSFWMQLRIKKALRAKFGPEVDTKGVGWYAVMRSFQLRRTRVPKALGKRGEFPG